MPNQYVVNPSTDPNWAWDVQGWQVQTNTGDLEKSAGPGQAGLGAGQVGLSGYVGATVVPDAVSTTLTLAATTSYMGLMYVPETSLVTNISTTTGGTLTGQYFIATYTSSTSVTVQYITTAAANLASTPKQAITGGPIVLPAGYYYLGVWAATSTSGTVASANAAAGSNSELNTSGSQYPRFATGTVIPTVGAVLTTAALASAPFLVTF